MALPTAQLGALGTMSMPYSMPTYEKGPSIWEKALASFLVNAAGGVASQGVENVMAKDHAKEFGQEKAGLWAKLSGGPTVNRDEAKQMRQNSFVADQNEAEMMARQGQSDADAANALLRLDQQGQQGQDLETIRSMNDLLRMDRGIEAQDLRDARQDEAAMALAKFEADARARLQRSEWEARLSMPDQQLNQTIVDRVRGTGPVPGNSGKNAAAGVNPNIATFAQNAGQGVQDTSRQGFDMPAEPQFVSNAEDVANFLAAGKTPEQILEIVGRQQAVNAAAQARPLPVKGRPMTNPYQNQANPQVDPVLVDLLSKLGLAPQRGLYSGTPEGLGIYGNSNR